MIIPELIDVVDAQLIGKWRDKIEKADECHFQKSALKAKEALKAQLDGDYQELADRLEVAVQNSMDYIYFEICKQLFYFAFKAGMGFQQALDSDI